MMEFVEGALKMTGSSWFIVFAMVGAGYLIVSQIMDSGMLALTLLPFNVVGAVLGQHSVEVLALRFADDRIVNTTIGMGGGIMLSTILVVGTIWSALAIMSR